MKLTLNWLKEYVDFDWSPEELEERLTMLGLEVESMEKTAGAFENIVVGQVISKEQHPGADRLSLCKVNDGNGERQIVCGATNFVVGSKIPLALPGCEIPTAPGEKPFIIKPGKIRGVKSDGMMCSGKELGITEDSDGLMLLPEDATVGIPFGEHLGRTKSDVIYDMEVTPNRPDWNSVIGIAREISVMAGNPLKHPDVSSLVESSEDTSAEDSVNVCLDAPELCHRYTARVIRGTKVGPSPDWLKDRLEAVGIRSISNIVDVTNYVMLETGQPLHAFDLHLLSKGSSDKSSIVVRTATDDERFTTLDNKEHQLNTKTLVIADKEKAIALAGVMGGLNTEINDSTTDVLIESAYFNPQNIRATSKAFNISTDSSYRFERGTDPENCDYVSRRAAQLILETAGGTLASGVVDARENKSEAKEITLRFKRTAEILGIEIPREEQVQTLERLELETVTKTDDAITMRPPSFRVDLKREIDLIEEVCRIYGI
ncbi:phenylalanine--tRNA ligase subunit beta, partial [Verrucomicrobia bacterium]|nr:phenylalanine--tRNA ligase subunit beta [Verrucomicrobiota bacterium]